MNWKYLYFSLKGRIGRENWWIGQLVLFALSTALTSILFWIVGVSPDYYWNDEPPSPQTALAEAISFILTFWLFFAVDIKRIHDRGRSAYLLVPLYLYSVYLLALEGFGWENPSLRLINELLENDSLDLTLYPQIAHMALLVLFALYFFWIIFELGFRRGTDGPGKYGPDPLELVDIVGDNIAEDKK